jgi:hypothetical protein
VLGTVKRAKKVRERVLGRRQLAPGEREPSLVVRQLRGPVRALELREERARVRERPAGGSPVPLPHRDSGERLIRPELIEGLAGPLVERQRLERLPPGRREVATGKRDQREELAGIHRARLVALGLEHGDCPVQLLRSRREVAQLHGDHPEARVRAGDRPQVVRPFALGSSKAKRFHRLAQVAPLAQEVTAIHERDGKPAPIPRLPKPPLRLAEGGERRVLAPAPVQDPAEAAVRLRLDPQLARAAGELHARHRLRGRARVGEQRADHGPAPPSLRLQVERRRGNEGSRRVEDGLGHHDAGGGPAGEPEADQGLRLR